MEQRCIHSYLLDTLYSILPDPILHQFSDNPIVSFYDHDEHEDAQHEIHDDEESFGDGSIGSVCHLSDVSDFYTTILGSYGGLVFRHGGNICNGVVFVHV